MMQAYIKAEGLKNRHTVSAKLFWAVPLVSLLISFLFSGQDAVYYQTNQYNWWYTTFFPMLLLLSTAFTEQREKRVKNRIMGTLPLDMKKLWAAKVIYSLKTLLYAALLLYCTQEIVSRILAKGALRSISGIAGLAAVCLWLALSAWQVPLWLFMSRTCGYAAGLLLGLAGNIGLGILGALSKWWFLNPFSYISRLMCPVLRILPNGLPAQPGSQTFSPEVLDLWTIPVGVLISGVLFFICFLVTANLYQRKGLRGWED